MASPSFVLRQQCTRTDFRAQQRVGSGLADPMDVAMQVPAMQVLVLIAAAALQHSETSEDVQALAEKLHRMVPALYHSHCLMAEDRTGLLHDLHVCSKFWKPELTFASSTC